MHLQNKSDGALCSDWRKLISTCVTGSNRRFHDDNLSLVSKLLSSRRRPSLAHFLDHYHLRFLPLKTETSQFHCPSPHGQDPQRQDPRVLGQTLGHPHFQGSFQSRGDSLCGPAWWRRTQSNEEKSLLVKQVSSEGKCPFTAGSMAGDSGTT